MQRSEQNGRHLDSCDQGTGVPHWGHLTKRGVAATTYEWRRNLSTSDYLKPLATSSRTDDCGEWTIKPSAGGLRRAFVDVRKRDQGEFSLTVNHARRRAGPYIRIRR